MKPKFSIAVDQTVIDKLDKIAESQDRSRNYIINKILKEYVYINQMKGDFKNDKV